ncbi:MAG: archease [Armatimonadota bacterium]
MGTAGHESVEHTADLAIRAWAPDLRGLVEQAARAMVGLLLTRQPTPERTVVVEGEGPTPEELLVDCLREILLLVELEALVPVEVEVLEVTGERARCRVGVVPLSAVRPWRAHEIKAVTYHGLEIERTQRGLQVQVVFDI